MLRMELMRKILVTALLAVAACFAGAQTTVFNCGGSGTAWASYGRVRYRW